MDIKQLVHDDILRILPEREKNSHKGNYGRVLLLCGSVGFTGAAALAAMGALRCGSGLVYLGVPESIYTIEAIKLNEAIVFPLTEKDGKLSSQAITEISERIAHMDAVLIGPGLGCCEDVYLVTKYVLENFRGPVIVDADGINALSEHKDILRGRTAPTVITPHPGEFLRLCGNLTGDRITDATDFANRYGVIVVLKGHETVITDGNIVYLNHTGNPGMAVGGSGDVLAGMIVSLLGQRIDPLLSSACGAWLHGAAGDICASEIGQYGMLPTDMLEVLPRLLK